MSCPISSCRAPDEATLGKANYVPFDNSRFAFPLETVKVRDWEEQEGRHSGGYVLDELRHIVQSRIDIELAQVHHMVSIVIPVLNEAETIEGVLKSVTALDFQELGLEQGSHPGGRRLNRCDFGARPGRCAT